MRSVVPEPLKSYRLPAYVRQGQVMSVLTRPHFLWPCMCAAGNGLQWRASPIYISYLHDLEARQASTDKRKLTVMDGLLLHRGMTIMTREGDRVRILISTSLVAGTLWIAQRFRYLAAEPEVVSLIPRCAS